MPNKTSIEWTDFSSQLIRYRNSAGEDVWACVKCSQGCAHCYSETLAKRFGRGGPFNLATVLATTPYFAEDEAKKIIRSKSISGKKVFVGDMTDVFGEWVPDELLDQMFAVFAMRPDVTFQVLTKRPERAASYFNDRDSHLAMTRQFVNFRDYASPVGPWPLPNVHLGVSVEDQATADARIPILLRTPAPIRFISAEPLLGPIDLNRKELICQDWRRGLTIGTYLDLVIAGGESGPKARPCHPQWARDLRDQCVGDRVAFLWKQWGEWAPYDNRVHGLLADPRDTHVGGLLIRAMDGDIEDTKLTPGGKVFRSAAQTLMVRVGKKAAGRMLDGRTWDECPVLPARSPA